MPETGMNYFSLNTASGIEMEKGDGVGKCQLASKQKKKKPLDMRKNFVLGSLARSIYIKYLCYTICSTMSNRSHHVKMFIFLSFIITINNSLYYTLTF